MRSTNVNVLPVPGPAITARARAVESTARSCSSFSPRAAGADASETGTTAFRDFGAVRFAFAGNADISNMAICPPSISSSPGANKEITPYSPS